MPGNFCHNKSRFRSQQQTAIHPYLTYGLPAWGQAGKKYLNKILIPQKRALRLLFFADVRDHAIPLFLAANVLPITFLYHECVASLMYDINSNNAPINMLHLFKETSSIHSFNTRSSTSGNLYVKTLDWKCKGVLSLDLG